MAGTSTQQGRGARGWVGIGAGLVILVTSVVIWGPNLVGGATGSKGTDPVARFLLAVALILFVAHACGAILRRWNQPPVLGEILGGLLLGPSALGLIAPGAQGWLFPAEALESLDKAAQLGLIVFMFLLGCELRTDNLGGARRTVGATVLGGMGLPFVVGLGVALGTQSMLAGSGAHGPGFVLFFGLALSITALPVLARILVDLKLDRTRLGTLSLSSAAIGDGIAWTALTLILATTGIGGAAQIATTAGLAVALVLVTILCVRPALAALVPRITSDQLLLAVLAVGAIGFSAVTQLINLHPVIGAFLFGAAVPRDCAAVERISQQLQGFAIAILLPLFFAGVGLGTSIGLLGGDPGHWLALAVVLTAALVTKFLGAGGAARLAGLPRREALQLGVLMNCRGITELVVATIGLRYGLVNQLGFTILVLVAVITTAITGPLMRVLRRDEVGADDGSAEPVVEHEAAR